MILEVARNWWMLFCTTFSAIINQSESPRKLLPVFTQFFILFWHFSPPYLSYKFFPIFFNCLFSLHSSFSFFFPPLFNQTPSRHFKTYLSLIFISFVIFISLFNSPLHFLLPGFPVWLSFWYKSTESFHKRSLFILKASAFDWHRRLFSFIFHFPSDKLLFSFFWHVFFPSLLTCLVFHPISHSPLSSINFF